MKPPPFAYIDPGTLPEALDVLAQHGDEGKILAGGQSLVPLLNMRLAQPAVLVDVNRLTDLDYVEPRQMSGAKGLAIGALTRQRTVEDLGSTSIPLLDEAITWVGHPQIRNRGTVGGSIAHADPSAEIPLVLRALDGVVTAMSNRGKRQIAAADLFVYALTTALDPDEVLTEVWLPLPAPRTGHAFLEVARRHGDFALVSVAVTLALSDGGMCEDARIAIGGAAPIPIRASRAEEALRGEQSGLDLFRQAKHLAAEETDPTGDIHADADYRREVAGTLTFRALKLASERAMKGDA